MCATSHKRVQKSLEGALFLSEGKNVKNEMSLALDGENSFVALSLSLPPSLKFSNDGSLFSVANGSC